MVATTTANPITGLVPHSRAVCVIATDSSFVIMVAALSAEPIAGLELLKQRPWKLASSACTEHLRTQVH